MKTIIVFGATGNLGAYCCVALMQEGYNVVAVGKRKSDNGFFTKQGISYYSIDIYNPKEFEVLPTKDVYAVIHFAGTLPSRYDYNPTLLIDSIVRGTLNVLEYMKIVGAKKIVFPQTPFDLYYLHNSNTAIPADAQRSFPPVGDHSIYTIAKNTAVDLIEHYHSEFGFSHFILRFFTIYQYHPNPYHYADNQRKIMPYRILMDKAMKGEHIDVWGDPNCAKEIVYIKDFTQAVCKCITSEKEGGIYNIGGGTQVSLDEQIQGIIDVFSKAPNISTKAYLPEMPNALNASFDMSKTKEELGYQPKYSYIEAMTDFYDEMQNEPFAQLWGTKEDYNK